MAADQPRDIAPCPACGGPAIFVGLKYYVATGTMVDKYRCECGQRWEVARVTT